MLFVFYIYYIIIINIPGSYRLIYMIFFIYYIPLLHVFFKMFFFMMFKRHGFFGSGSSDVWWSLRSSRLTGVDPTVVTKDESWQFYGMNRLRTNWRNGHNKWEFYGILHERNGHWLEILHIWPEMGIEIWKWEENWDLHRFSRLNLWSSMWIWIQQTPGATANWNHWGLERREESCHVCCDLGYTVTSFDSGIFRNCSWFGGPP